MRESIEGEQRGPHAAIDLRGAWGQRPLQRRMFQLIAVGQCAWVIRHAVSCPRRQVQRLLPALEEAFVALMYST
jgi:hypothetical protein